MGSSQRPEDPDMDSGLNHHHLSWSSFYPPIFESPNRFCRASKGFTPDLKKTSSQMPEGPDMDSVLNHHHLPRSLHHLGPSYQRTPPRMSISGLQERSSLMPEGPDMDSVLNHHHLPRSLHHPGPSYQRTPPRMSISGLQERSSLISKDPSVNPKADVQHSVRPPYFPSCTSETSSVSGVSIKRDNSIGRLINFPVNSTGPSVNPKADVQHSVRPPYFPPEGPDMDPESDDVGSVQSEDTVRSTESFKYRGRQKSKSAPLTCCRTDMYSSSEVEKEKS